MSDNSIRVFPDCPMTKEGQEKREAALAEPGFLVLLENWSGDKRPYRAMVFRDGKFLGTTGGCGSPSAAEKCAMAIVNQHRAS